MCCIVPAVLVEVTTVRSAEVGFCANLEAMYQSKPDRGVDVESIGCSFADPDDLRGLSTSPE